MSYVIGIDYGTLSARAVLVCCEDGAICASHRVAYPSGVMEGSLASVREYDDALTELLSAMADSGHAAQVRGICVDATSLSLVPLDRNLIPLGLRADLCDSPHAQIKLWKRHTAQGQAEEALALAREMGEPFLTRVGGSVSGEGMLPKLMESRDCDSAMWKELDLALDLCDYLTFSLCGSITRSAPSLGFKSLCFQDLGMPSAAYLDRLRPGLSREYAHLLRGETAVPGQKVGVLRPQIADRFGFPHDTAVATGVIDAHTPMLSLGALFPGDGALVVGTSTVLTVQTKQLREIDGLSGTVKDAYIPGMYGIESSQGCTGDMLDWYIRNALPASVTEEAHRRGISPHQLLAESIERPHENRVTAADWWNGSRNVPCDLTLRGVMAGMTLETRPADIYLALLQAMVCGTRTILDRCAEHGAGVRRLLCTGGMARKSPLLMQQYANILGMPLYVGNADEGPAVGSALLAACAAGIFHTPHDAWEKIGIHAFTSYHPDTEHREEYERLYRRNLALRQAICHIDRL